MSSVQERISLLAEKDVIARAVTAKANYFSHPRAELEYSISCIRESCQDYYFPREQWSTFPNLPGLDAPFVLHRVVIRMRVKQSVGLVIEKRPILMSAAPLMLRVPYLCGCICTGIGCNSGIYFDWQLPPGRYRNTGTKNCVDSLLDWHRWHASGTAAFFSC